MLDVCSGASLWAVLMAVGLVWDMHGYSCFRTAVLAACSCFQPSCGSSAVLDCTDPKLRVIFLKWTSSVLLEFLYQRNNCMQIQPTVSACIKTFFAPTLSLVILHSSFPFLEVHCFNGISFTSKVSRHSLSDTSACGVCIQRAVVFTWCCLLLAKENHIF